MRQPFVSILIVTWNRRDELLRSIDSALTQTYRNIEIVVIDNCSSDGTAEMIACRYPRVRYIRLDRNVGCPSGRNIGFSHCQGKYIYQLDDDGWLKADAVEIAVQRAESDPTIAVVMSRIHEVEDGQVLRALPAGQEAPAYQYSFIGCCSMIRRDAFARAGGYPEDFFRQAEEDDLALRLLEHGYFCFLEPASIMYHAPSPIGRNLNVFLYYSLRNTNKTGLRLWPFPWCVLRPLVNFAHACRYMVSRRYPILLVCIWHEMLADLRALRGRRHPVSAKTFRLYRRLQKMPSLMRPA